MVVAVVGAAAGVGVGLLLCWRALRPPPPPLAKALARLETSPTPADTTTAEPTAWKERTAHRAFRVLSAAGLLDTERLRRKLRVLGKTPEQHAFEKLALGLIGLCLPVLVGLTAVSFGVRLPLYGIAAAAMCLGLFGLFQPEMTLPGKVERRRISFRAHLSSYLDVVSIILAGGGGLETALSSAVSAGKGWPFDELRGALRRARYSRASPWDEFDSLGQALGVDDLCELAASARLAGDQGAQVRSSLTAKAESMRAEQAAAAEAKAEVASEKMLIPVVLLFLGMLIFVGYAAVHAISTPTGIP